MMIEQEVVIFCDKHGTPTGEIGPKLASHTSHTKMHLAFSVYVFNDKGEFLVTQRAASKKVWPRVWTNSCCGHLGVGETTIDAIKRRLATELQLEAKDFTQVVTDYTYITPPYEGIIEHEFCPIYFARAVNEPLLNPEEVSDFAWVTWDEYIKTTSADNNEYTNLTSPDAPKWSWWCKDQLKHIDSKVVRQFSDPVTD